MMTQLIWLTIALPLAGVLINGLFGRRLGHRVVSIVAPLMVLLAFLVGVGAFFETSGREEAVIVPLWTWATVGDFNVSFDLLVDPLSVLMVLIVTGVGFLIHVYATD
jgi:NADH-quinone oxidoreductase subunit L